MTTNDLAQKARVGILFCCIVLLSACVSQNSRAPSNEAATTSKSAAADHALGVLEQAYAEYEIARLAGDAPAMVHAAMKRLEVSKTLLSESAATQLSQKTVEMILQARGVAADDRESLAKIDATLSEADLDLTREFGGSGNLFGNLGKLTGALKSEQLLSYTLAPGDIRLIRLRVASDSGAIVYVEAPARRGVTLRVVEDDGTPLCSDSSEHGVLICRWRPESNGFANVTIEHDGAVEVAVLMLTNRPVVLAN